MEAEVYPQVEVRLELRPDDPEALDGLYSFVAVVEGAEGNTEHPLWEHISKEEGLVVQRFVADCSNRGLAAHMSLQGVFQIRFPARRQQ